MSENFHWRNCQCLMSERQSACGKTCSSVATVLALYLGITGFDSRKEDAKMRIVHILCSCCDSVCYVQLLAVHLLTILTAQSTSDFRQAWCALFTPCSGVQICIAESSAAFWRDLKGWEAWPRRTPCQPEKQLVPAKACRMFHSHRSCCLLLKDSLSMLGWCFLRCFPRFSSRSHHATEEVLDSA